MLHNQTLPTGKRPTRPINSSVGLSANNGSDVVFSDIYTRSLLKLNLETGAVANIYTYNPAILLSLHKNKVSALQDLGFDEKSADAVFNQSQSKGLDTFFIKHPFIDGLVLVVMDYHGKTSIFHVKAVNCNSPEECRSHMIELEEAIKEKGLHAGERIIIKGISSIPELK